MFIRIKEDCLINTEHVAKILVYEDDGVWYLSFLNKDDKRIDCLQCKDKKAFEEYKEKLFDALSSNDLAKELKEINSTLNSMVIKV